MSAVIQSLDQHDGLVLKTELPHVVFWEGHVYARPEVDVLTSWVLYGLSETPAGDECEMDSPGSWLVLLGLL
jgi:hypothetical protein